MDRAQVPTTAIEAGVGLLLLLAVTFTFALGVPGPQSGQHQLDAYASDALTLLENESPRHGSETRLSELTASTSAFERESDVLRRRMDRILPDNLMFRVETVHGTVGYPFPAGATAGTATVTTVNGPVMLTVWYA